MAMGARLWVLLTVAAGSLLTVTAPFAVLFLGLALKLTEVQAGVLVLVAIAIGDGLAAWWVFRLLQRHHTRAEARAVAKTFAAFAPVALLVAMPLALFPGAYAEWLFGQPLVGAFFGIVILVAVLNFGAALLALSVTGRTGETE
jgi:hypothetical protein